MVKLPTRDDLSPLPPARTGRGIATIRPAVPDTVAAQAAMAGSGKYLAQGLQQIGQGIGMASSALNNMDERGQALAAIKARASYEKGMLDFKRGFNERSDYENFDKDFTDGEKTIRESSLAMIPEGEQRDRWSAQFDLEAAQHRDGIITLGTKIRRDRDLADVQTSVNDHVKVLKDANSTPQEKASANRAISLAISAAQKTNLISATDAVKFNEELKAEKLDFAKSLYATDPRTFLEQTDPRSRSKAFHRREESTNTYSAYNQLGYAGIGQFGGPRLTELGVYTPGEHENVRNGWSGQKWSGTLNIPGHPEVKTIRDFLESPEAQETVMDLHYDKMDKEIESNGFDKYIGTTVRGVPITRDALYAMLHLGGVGSTRDALTGVGNATDANGKSVLQRAAEASGEASLFDDVDPAEIATYRSKAGHDLIMNDFMLKIANGQAGDAEFAEFQQKYTGILDADDLKKIDTALSRSVRVGSLPEANKKRFQPNAVWNALDSDDTKRSQALTEEAPQEFMAMNQEYIDKKIIPLIAGDKDVPGTHMITNNVKGSFEALLSSQDPAKIQFALKNMDTLEKADPRAFARDMGAERVKTLTRYREQLYFHTPEEVAVMLNADAGDTKKAVASDALDSKGDAEAKKLAPYVEGFLVDNALNSSNVIPPSRFTGMAGAAFAPKLPEGIEQEEMRQEFITIFKGAMRETGGDVQLSTKMAISVFKTKWGVSNVTGEPRIMRRPPEAYTPEGVNPEWVKHQARARLFPIVGENPFDLRADDRTELEIAHGYPPTYQVMVPNEQRPEEKPDLSGYKILSVR